MNDPLVADTIACLKQGIALLNRLSPEQYALTHPHCFNNSVGGHMRHNLDHFTCLLAGLPAARVDYDARTRDKLVETDPRHAAGRLDEVSRELDALDLATLARELAIKMDSGSELTEEQAWARSTTRREVQFLLSHTIHHYALVAVMCHRLGVALEPNFGVAPSTRHFQQSQETICAR
ncbi:MAG TPA: DinB family protein [Opitutales bacterium]|nr:DinB family protein [Opitutales bacterium]